jgi:hypothetical protein
MIVSYETSDHQTGRVRLPIRGAQSEWQQRTCYLRSHPADRNL